MVHSLSVLEPEARKLSHQEEVRHLPDWRGRKRGSVFSPRQTDKRKLGKDEGLRWCGARGDGGGGSALGSHSGLAASLHQQENMQSNVGLRE